MRVVGLDLGTARVGVAASDSSGTIATPRDVLQRTGDPEADMAAIVRAVEEPSAAAAAGVETPLVAALPGLMRDLSVEDLAELL